MGRLIDADALKRYEQKIATQAWKMKIKASVETILNQFIDDIDHAPTVDAVPVVRCKDCRYFRCNMRGNGTLPNGVCVLLWRGGYDPMDFCSEGERKDGNSNGL